VGGGSMKRFGFLQRAEDYLKEAGMEVKLFEGIESDPSVDTVMKGAKVMEEYQPDWIVAIGGGSPIDAAKAMWIKYEYPDITFEDMCKVFGIPKLRKKAHFCAIPSTSGTATEVTAFSIITDYNKGIKYPIADFEITPDVAIVDPDLAETMPVKLVAHTGMDAMTHAIEAYVSILASDFTDGWAKQAVKLVFENLEKSVLEGDPDARIKMHNAASIAGMAFANAFLGMNHSLAHKIGGEWHIPHGRTNGMLLPHVIRYNGTVPTKLNIWPKIEDYKADKKYRELAELIGLHPKTDAEGVEMFAQAVEKLWVKVGGAVNVKSQNISKADWEESVHRIAMNAYEDQCTPANPRMPMVKDMEVILETIYDYESPFAKK